MTRDGFVCSTALLPVFTPVRAKDKVYNRIGPEEAERVQEMHTRVILSERQI